MKKQTFAILIFLVINATLFGQSNLKIKAFSIFSPTPEKVDDFIAFIDNELAPNGINTLVLQVDYNYSYKSRPELREENPLTYEDVKKLVSTCKKNNIEIIPQVNLLGHQSDRTKLRKLLSVYPEFDETPHIKIPEKYVWPNKDELYCKSYCPLHPKVHEVVFDLVDEIVEVFEAKAFHAGMDEVFYIADSKCPRCQGQDPSILFAGEVSKLANHLALRNVRLWIWGDRLIDGKTTGIGMWEASYNNTYRAIDLIPKSVVICDWHYTLPQPTPSYFVLKGFDVLACTWNQPEVAEKQVLMMNNLKENANSELKERYLGVMQTVWSSVDDFLKEYANYKPTEEKINKSQVASYKAMVKTIDAIEKD